MGLYNNAITSKSLRWSKSHLVYEILKNDPKNAHTQFPTLLLMYIFFKKDFHFTKFSVICLDLDVYVIPK